MADERDSVSGHRPPLRILLLDTSPRHRPGSMRRYGELVEAATASAPDVELRRWDLGPPYALSSAVPSRLEPWLRRAWASLDTVLRQARADVVHVLDASSGLSLGLRLGAPVVATIHDVIPLLQLRKRLDGGPRPSAMARRVIERAAHDLARASRVLADSHRTAQDVVDLTGVEASRVTTIALPVPPAFLPPPREGSRDGRMVLHVGNGGFYKNRAGLLRIVALVRRTFPARLVIVGEGLSRELQRLAHELELSPHVEVRREATDAELRAAYGEAALLLMPSRYEGFGWPALEAMACGCPVVCSNAGALPEVVGPAALTTLPDDEAGLAAHAVAVLGDPVLARRLSEQGRQRAKGFRLTEMGGRLMEAYHSAARTRQEAVS